MTRERGFGFVPVMNGRRIGFREPDDRSDREIAGSANELVWTIGEIGTPVLVWNSVRQLDVEAASTVKFSSWDEQCCAVSMIKQALRVFYDLDRDKSSRNIKVVFSSSLNKKLESGELING